VREELNFKVLYECLVFQGLKPRFTEENKFFSQRFQFSKLRGRN